MPFGASKMESRSGSLSAWIVSISIVGIVIGVCGCDSENSLVAGDEVVPGISVLVVDRSTGSPARAAAEGWLIDGDYMEKMVCWSSYADSETPSYTLLQGAWERSGTYEVIIKPTGFEFWTRTDVVVKVDGRHIEPYRSKPA